MPFYVPEEIYQEKKEKKLRGIEAFTEELEKLPLKQQNLVIQMLINPTNTMVGHYKAAGYSVGPNSKLHHIFKKVQGKLGKGLLALGVTEADIMKVINEGLKATKTMRVKNVSIDSKGNKTVKNEVVVIGPDHPMRLKTAEILLKLGDYMPAGKLNVKHEHEGEVGFVAKMSLEERKQKELEFASREIESNYEVQGEGTIN